MDHSDRAYFEILKTKISETMRANHAGINQSIEDWRGNEIQKFQEELEKKVNAYISEKSFYNHFKSYNEKLPRIDLLNILSRYTGYNSWQDFRDNNKDKLIEVDEYKGSNKIIFWLPAVAFVAFVITWLLIKAGDMETYTFRIEDKDTHEYIPGGMVNVLIQGEKSSSNIIADSTGSFRIKTGERSIKIIPHIPYYLQDTLTYNLAGGTNTQVIFLKADDYALMLHYFSNSRIDDWQKRRNKLQVMIADNAYICQVLLPKMTGIELYNKSEFIDLLTTPSGTLKNITLLEVLYSHDKITTIRFIADSDNR